LQKKKKRGEGGRKNQFVVKKRVLGESGRGGPHAATASNGKVKGRGVQKDP